MKGGGRKGKWVENFNLAEHSQKKKNALCLTVTGEKTGSSRRIVRWLTLRKEKRGGRGGGVYRPEESVHKKGGLFGAKDFFAQGGSSNSFCTQTPTFRKERVTLKKNKRRK